MAYKEGSMSTDQLRKIFGDSLQVRDDGHVTFSNDGDVDKFMDNSALRNTFIGEMGREGSDWTDGIKSENDLGSLVRFLSNDEKPETDDAPTERPRFAHSPEVAHAKARLDQHKEDVWSGKTGTDLWGDTASNDPAQSFLERYKLKLGKKLEDGTYLEPEE
jgi:hypothetical protein